MGGRRGYGPTHSQSMEKFFLGIPDLLVIALNRFLHPGIIYNRLLKDYNQPALVIENKVLYTQLFGEGLPTGFDLLTSDEIFPTIMIAPSETVPRLTVVCYGGMVDEVLKAIAVAFDEDEIVCEIIIPSLLNPLNIGPMVDATRKSGRLLIVEEGSCVAALSSEIAAGIAESGVRLNHFSRLSNNTIVPSAAAAEGYLLPNTASIYQAIIRATTND